MVNVKSWKEYQSRSTELFNKDPKQVSFLAAQFTTLTLLKYRYCVKWRPAKNDLVVKSTNNDECLKYKTQSASILNRFESFNRTLMYHMSNTPIPEPPVEQPAQATQQPQESSSSSNKKKKNKKKK